MRQLSTLPGWSKVQILLGPFIICNPSPTAHSSPGCSLSARSSGGREFSPPDRLEQGTLDLDRHNTRQNIHIVLGSAANPYVLFRLEDGFKAFFRRMKNGEKPGYPRFQGRHRYNSFTSPDGAGWKLEEHKRPADKTGRVSVKLRLTKIGTVKLHLHRDLAGTIKTLTLKREGEHWYAVFTCEIGKPEALPVSSEDVGIELGVSHFGALSNGEVIDNPRYYRQAEKKLKKLQGEQDFIHVEQAKFGSIRFVNYSQDSPR
jgi:hypothetical protein